MTTHSTEIGSHFLSLLEIKQRIFRQNSRKFLMSTW